MCIKRRIQNYVLKLINIARRWISYMQWNKEKDMILPFWTFVCQESWERMLQGKCLPKVQIWGLFS